MVRGVVIVARDATSRRRVSIAPVRVGGRKLEPPAHIVGESGTATVIDVAPATRNSVGIQIDCSATETVPWAVAIQSQSTMTGAGVRLRAWRSL